MAENIIINGNTKLSDLLKAYPRLKDELIKINHKFKLLNSPLGKVMAKKATISEMSARAGTDENILIEKISFLIRETGS